VNIEVADPGFNEGSLMDLGRFRGTSPFAGMHRTYAGASVLVATKPAELATGLRMLEVLLNVCWADVQQVDCQTLVGMPALCPVGMDPTCRQSL
jgi:hypothetical protein